MSTALQMRWVFTVTNAILLVFILAGLSACESSKDNTRIMHKPSLTLRYQTSAEAMYIDIRVEDGRLSYTFFDDADNRCAQWFKSSPCWSEDDLETRERALSHDDIEQLYELALQLVNTAWPETTLGEQNLRQRAYTETLTVVAGDSPPQKLRYRSTPQAEAKPVLFARLEGELRYLATGTPSFRQTR